MLGAGKGLDAFRIFGFIFGMLGFVLSMSAIRQISELKTEVEKLKSKAGPNNES